MRDYLPFIIVGLTSGAVYAIASLGLVLTYTTSGVFNFAHGAVGMFATYAFYTLRVDLGLPTALAVALALFVVAPALGLVIDRLLFRRLEGAPAATYVVASLGLLVALQGLASVLYGSELRPVHPIFPTWTYKLDTLFVGIDQTIVVGLAVASGIGLMLFFKKTRLGILTRAVVSDRELTGLTGGNASGITTFSWMLGSSFATAAGILVSPLVGLDSLLLTLLVVEAFGAAIVGRLRSFPLTLAGALGIGVVQGVATKIVSDLGQSQLSGLPTAIPVLTLFVVLVFSRRGAFVEVTTLRRVTGPRRSGRRASMSAVQFGTVAAVALLVPTFVTGSHLLTATTALIFVLLFSSLSLLVGQSRQVSLSHAIFAALGATTLAHLHNAGVPFVVALPLAGLAVVPLGALISIPAIRLSGLFLALATFGFGVLTQSLLFPTGFMFGAAQVVNIPRSRMLAGDRAFFYFVLAVVALGVLAVEAVRRSRLGRMLVALGDSPTAVSSLGVNPLATRVLTFCLSAFLAALAGGLIGAQVQAVNPVTFSFFQSLVWVTVLVAAGAYSFGGAVLAALLFNVVPMVFTAKAVTEWQPVAFGVLALTLAQADNGLVGLLGRIRAPAFGRARAATEERPLPDGELIPAEVGTGSYEAVSR